MNISGSFKNIDNDTIEVTISGTGSGNYTIGETKDDNGLVVAYFGDDPVQIETDCDDNFVHIIKRSATINLQLTKYLGDMLYSNNASSIKVNINRNGICVFNGYVTPNAYTQSYSSVYDELSINCIDFLSTLEYEKLAHNTSYYDLIKSESAIMSFKDYISKIFENVLDDHPVFYDSSKLTTSGTSALDGVGVSENLFLGDEFDDLMSNEEILEEILRFLNLHIIQVGKAFYIFDWDNLRNKSITWTQILGSGPQQWTTGNTVNISKDDYGSDDTNVSTADVYNQIILTDDITSIDTVIDSPLDDDTMSTLWRAKKRYETEIYVKDWGNSQQKQFVGLLVNDTDVGKSDDFKAYDYFVKLMKSNMWTFNYFNVGSSRFFDSYNLSTSSLNFFNQINSYKFGTFLAQFGRCDHKVGSTNNDTYNAPTSMDNYICIVVNGTGDDSEEMFSTIGTKLETMYNAAKNYDSGLMVYNSSSSVAWGQVGGTGAKNYIVFSGKMCLQPLLAQSIKLGDTLYWPVNYREDGDAAGLYGIYFYGESGKEKVDLNRFYFTDPGTKWKYNNFKYSYNSDGTKSDLIGKIGVLQCTMQISNKYCVETCDYKLDSDGNYIWGYESQYTWMTESEWKTAVANKPKTSTGRAVVEESCPSFSLGFDPDHDDYIIGEEYDISNNITASMNLGDMSGTAIYLPDDLSGQIKFRVIGLVNSEFDSVWRRHPTMFRHTKYYTNSKTILEHISSVIISDFECQIASDNSGIENDYDNDVVYYSDEVDKYIQTKDDIEFKINTLLSAEEAYEGEVTAPSVNISSAIDIASGKAIGAIRDNVNGIDAYAEKLYINQYWNMFNSPRMIVETTLRNTYPSPFNTYTINYLSREFYPLGINSDLRMNTDTLTLIENQVIPTQYLSADSTSMTTNSAKRINYSVYPLDTTDKVTFESSDSSVVSIDEKGNMTSTSTTGSVTITITSGGVSEQVAVHVVASEVPCTGISITSSDITINELNDTYQIQYTVEPSNTTDEITFTSSDASVATVDNNGVVRAISEGTVTITVKCGNYTDAVPVTINTSTVEIPCTGVTVTDSTISFDENDPYGTDKQITYTLEPSNTTDKPTFSSSDESVVTVDSNGNVTSVGAGTATITVTCGDVTTTIDVTVAEYTGTACESISITSASPISFSSESGYGETSQIEYTLTPSDTTDTVKFYSSDESICTVSDTGLVTSVSNGSANIMIMCGEAGSTVNVTVAEYVVKCTGITINSGSLGFSSTNGYGETAQIDYTLEPSNTTQTVTFVSNDNSIATVDYNGLVTSVGAGTATITVTCGDATATVNVTVAEYVEQEEGVWTANIGKYYKIPWKFDYGYKIVADVIFTSTSLSDTLNFKNFAPSDHKASPIEFNYYIDGAYVDYNYPESTTDYTCSTSDNDCRIDAYLMGFTTGTKYTYEIRWDGMTVYDADGNTYYTASSGNDTGYTFYDGEYYNFWGFIVDGIKQHSLKIYDDNNNLLYDYVILSDETVKDNVSGKIYEAYVNHCTGVKINSIENGVVNYTLYPNDFPTSRYSIVDTVTFSSSDESIATVDEYGNITKVSDGICDITVTCGDYSDMMSYTSQLVVHCTGITINNTLSINVTDAYIGQSVYLTGNDYYTINPSDCIDAVTFTSSDTSVATVDSNGLLIITGVGECTIYVSCGDYTEALVAVNITESDITVTTSSFYVENTTDSDSTINYVVKSVSNNNTNWTVKYMLEDGTINKFIVDHSSDATYAIPIKANSKTYIASNNLINGYDAVNIVPECTCKIGGDITSLANSTSAVLKFGNIFKASNNITNAYNLSFKNVTEVTDRMFQDLFRDNTGLVTPPMLELGTDTLYDYCFSHMFDGCTSLKINNETFFMLKTHKILAPYCYQYMFNGCTSLSYSPGIYGKLYDHSCEYMFYGCSSLSILQILSDDYDADNIIEACYYMMYNADDNWHEFYIPYLTYKDTYQNQKILGNYINTFMSYGIVQCKDIDDWNDSSVNNLLFGPYNWLCVDYRNIDINLTHQENYINYDTVEFDVKTMYKILPSPADTSSNKISYELEINGDSSWYSDDEISISDDGILTIKLSYDDNRSFNGTDYVNLTFTSEQGTVTHRWKINYITT